MEIVSSGETHRDMLARGEILSVDGKLYRQIAGPIQHGDTYFAERNEGPRILHADRVDYENGYVIPMEPAFVYATHECVKVEEV